MILKFRKIDGTVDETMDLQANSFDSWEFAEGIRIEVFELLKEFQDETLLKQKYSAKISLKGDWYTLAHFNTGYLMNDKGETIETFR